QVLAPGPLSEIALVGMVAAALGDGNGDGVVDSGFARACYGATGGNPLLVSELLRALASEGVRPVAGEGARVRRIGAVAVGPAVMARLRLLGERAQLVAQVVVVVGEGARREDLATVAGINEVELEDLLAMLRDAGVIGGGQRVAFVHPLVADAVRDSLTPF